MFVISTFEILTKPYSALTNGIVNFEQPAPIVRFLRSSDEENLSVIKFNVLFLHSKQVALLRKTSLIRATRRRIGVLTDFIKLQ